jgi:hypothetical protein
MHQYMTALYDRQYQAPTAAQAEDRVSDLPTSLGRLGRKSSARPDSDVAWEENP